MLRILKLPLFWIFALALIFRVYKLGTFPAGFHVDEVKVAWNSYSLFKTGKDDWGNVLPIFYNTFGDHRPTGIFYASVPVISLLGPTEFATRLTGALFGSLAVIAIYFIALEFLDKKSAVITSFLLAVMPWHITLSRATSEGVIALTLMLFGLALFIRSRYKMALMMLFLSLLFYHTGRLLVPLMVLVYWLKKPTKKGFYILSIVIGVVAVFIANPKSTARLNQVSIFNDLNLHDDMQRLPFEEGPNHVFIARLLHNKPVLYANAFINQYVQYFSPNFFITPLLSKPARYSTVGVGLLSYVEFGLFVIGLIFVAKRKMAIWIPILLLLSPIPAAFTTEDVPNLHRTLFMIPWVAIVSASSFGWIKKSFQKLFWVIVTVIFINTAFFWHQYSVHNPRRYALQRARNVGVIEIVAQLQDLQTKYKQVILTNIPDNLYPWYATYTKQDPATFNSIASKRGENSWQFGNVVFSSLKCPSNYILEQHLINTAGVDAEGCDDQSKKLNLVGKIDRSSNNDSPYTIWASR